MGKPYTAQMKFCFAAAQRNLKRIKKLLTEKPSCVSDIAKQVSLSHNGASAYVNYLHKVLKPKQIYICAWELKGEKKKVYTALYAVGELDDVPKPKAKTSTEKSRLRAQKIQQERRLHGWVDKRKTADKPKPKPSTLGNSWIRLLTTEPAPLATELDKGQQ